MKRPKGGKPYYPDGVTPPPILPEAEHLKTCGLPLSDAEFDYVRGAMAVYAVSRQPRLTFGGWMMIAGALAIGETKAAKTAKSRTGAAYNAVYGPFLRASGFAFINKGDRWALRQLFENRAKIEPWWASLSPTDRAHANAPQEVWKKFNAADQDEVAKLGRAYHRKKHELPSQSEYVAALEELRAFMEQRIDELEATIIALGGSIPRHTKPTQDADPLGDEAAQERPEPMFEE